MSKWQYGNIFRVCVFLILFFSVYNNKKKLLHLQHIFFFRKKEMTSLPYTPLLPHTPHKNTLPTTLSHHNYPKNTQKKTHYTPPHSTKTQKKYLKTLQPNNHNNSTPSTQNSHKPFKINHSQKPQNPKKITTTTHKKFQNKNTTHKNPQIKKNHFSKIKKIQISKNAKIKKIKILKIKKMRFQKSKIFKTSLLTIPQPPFLNFQKYNHFQTITNRLPLLL